MEQYTDAAQDVQGNAIAGATVTVKKPDGTLAVIYSDNGVNTKANPFTTSTDGEYGFYAANGLYTVEIAKAGYATDTKVGVVLYDPRGTEILEGEIDVDAGRTVRDWLKVTNLGPLTGYGSRYGYVSYAYGANTFDLAEATICRWERPNDESGGTGMTDWRVAISPKTLIGNHQTVIAEWDIVFRGADTGWLHRRSQSNTWAGGVQVAPEAKDFSGTGGDPTNILFGFVFTNSPAGTETDRIGFRPRMYNALMGEPNSIHEEGYAIHWCGSDGTGGLYGGAPVAALGLKFEWQSGFRTDAATFTLDPVVFGPLQGVSWYDDATRLARYTADSSGAVLEGLSVDSRGVKNSRAWGAVTRAAAGDTQTRRMVLCRAVNNPTNIQMTTENAADTATNKFVLPASGVCRVRASVVAQTPPTVGAGWEVTALVARDATTNVTIISSTITKDTSSGAAATWALTLAPDNTFGTLDFLISGTGGFTVAADVNVVELAGA